jgi:hypothetical protein
MKIEQKKTFEPITITLETEEEADGFVGFLRTAHAYRGNYGPKTIATLKSLWEEFNKVYTKR